MQLEAVGKLAEAGLIYKAILEEDETNVVSVIQDQRKGQSYPACCQDVAQLTVL